MKKITLVIAMICSAFLLWSCANHHTYSCESIKAEYEEFLDQSVSMSDAERAQKLALFCKRIANGNSGQANEYAALLREIIGKDVKFKDSEVFDLADNYASALMWLADGNEDTGIQSISISRNKQGKKLLDISYIDVREYRIKSLTADDMEYFGDQLIPYDGSLGQYRLEITFFDTYASDELIKNYPLWEVHSFHGETIKFKCVTTPDHGFVLYVGSDKPFPIDQETTIELIYPMDNIFVPIP